MKIAMALADDCYGEIPKQVRDRFTDGYQPLYAEDSHNTLPHYQLLGSALMRIKEQEDKRVKMLPHPAATNASAATSRRSSVASNIRSGSILWLEKVKRRISRRSRNDTETPATSCNGDVPPTPKPLARSDLLQVPSWNVSRSHEHIDVICEEGSDSDSGKPRHNTAD
ncbi:hypothetical protein AAVH_16210 [Aphelenchoides avenae]|nr:hypothetical protein AAVH_16210 [Aphelenchus avenae]